MRRVLSLTVLAIFVMTAAPALAAEKFVVVVGQSTIGPNEAVTSIVPQHLGYFKEEGLEVEFQTSTGGTPIIQLLATGRVDMGMLPVSGLMLGRQRGVDVVAVYNWLTKHATSIAVLADGKIKTPADLRGKQIGVYSMTSTRAFDGRAMVKAAGLDPDKDVKWLAVGFGAQAAAALTRGDVQALALWDAAYADIENLGMKLQYFTFPFQNDLLGYTYSTTDRRLKAGRESIVGFLRGVAKGTVFSMANPRAATCVYFEATGELKAAADKERTFRNTLNIVKNNLANAELSTPSTRWGSFPGPETWKINEKYYREIGVVSKELPATDYFVSDRAFYEAINKFDANAIAAQAKNYTCRSM